MLLKPRTDKKVFPGHEYEDKLIKIYALVDKVVSIGDGEFVNVKEPEVVDSFHMRKRIQEESKGADLKSIVKRVETTGDISLLNGRTPVYGDTSGLPKTTGEAYQKALNDSKKLNSLGEEELKFIASCRGKSTEEISTLVTDYLKEKSKKDDKAVKDNIPDKSKTNESEVK